jgi:galactonate dehydratase
MPTPTPSRRSFFKSASAVAAGAVAASIASAQDALKDVANPSKDAEDRASAIKITALYATRAGSKAYLRIDTNHKVSGWGEVTGLEPDIACVLARSLYELLDQENPTRIEHLWQKIFRSHRDMRGGAFVVDVLSGIDMALWDIAGKLHGVPVYRLLGGPTRDKIRCYPNANPSGIRSHKVGTGGPHPFSGDPKDIDNLVRMVADARKRVGPEGSVMFDAHSAVPPPMLIQFAAAIKPYDVLWIEEPAVPGNIEVFKRLKQSINIPLATGERDRTIWGMIPYLQERCIDILQPDVGHTGGISQVKKIATLAEAYNTPVAPHNTCSELGLTAGLHAVAAVPNFLIHEAYLDGHIMPPGVARKNWEQDKDGYASLPQGPGLGVEIDEAAIAKVNEDPKKKFKWPTPKMKDGSVYDY